MLFTYTYRSSDGQRHTAKIEAVSRDAAFAKVRSELGVKPIKVVAEPAAGGPQSLAAAKPGGPQGAERVSPTSSQVAIAALAAIALVLALALAGGLMARRDGGGRQSVEALARDGDRYRAETVKRFKALLRKAWAVRDGFSRAYEDIDLRRLANYELIEELSDVTPLYRLAEKGQALIAQTKREVRGLFADLRSMFPPESENELGDAQRLYGEMMESLEAKEIALSNRKYALALLDGNRGKWKCRGGKVSFSDERLDKLFKYCLQGAEDGNAATARWNRDFGAELK